jgi:hypothetical protein
MSISNVRFLDGDNYCYVCAAKIDNEHRPEFQAPIRPDDPIIENEKMIFCSPKCFMKYSVYKTQEEEQEQEIIKEKD